jgi:antitoxin component YwqK of YwqJK toxin-antitoxin module
MEVRREGVPKQGPSVTYHPGGQREAEGAWSDDFQEGPWRFFAEDGRLVLDGVFRGGKKVGLWTRRQEDGSTETHEFEAGVEHGRSRVVDASEHLLEEGQWLSGQMTGTWSTWFSSGVLQSRGTRVNGSREGLWTRWFESNIKAREGNYSDDVPSGTWRQWSREGVLLSEGEILNGSRSGPWRVWHEDGHVDREQTGLYRDGVKVGELVD